MEEQKQKDFLGKNYKIPKSPSEYLTLKKEDTTRFRILTPAMCGWQIYDGENIPIRTREEANFTKEQLDTIYATYKKDKKREKPSHFWAFVVYDAEDSQVPFKVAIITQKGIKDAIMTLIDDKDYGQPYHYDLKITRKGADLNTEYTVLPAPKDPLPKAIIDTFEGMQYNLENLFLRGKEAKSVFE